MVRPGDLRRDPRLHLYEVPGRIYKRDHDKGEDGKENENEPFRPECFNFPPGKGRL